MREKEREEDRCVSSGERTDKGEATERGRKGMKKAKGGTVPKLGEECLM